MNLHLVGSQLAVGIPDIFQTFLQYWIHILLRMYVVATCVIICIPIFKEIIYQIYKCECQEDEDRQELRIKERNFLKSSLSSLLDL